MLNKQSRAAYKGWSSRLGAKNERVRKCHSGYHLMFKNLISKCKSMYFYPLFHIGVKFDLTQGEGHRPRVFESRVLRTTFASKKEEVTGGLIKLQNAELHNCN
jgi:hypothetical protein